MMVRAFPSGTGEPLSGGHRDRVRSNVIFGRDLGFAVTPKTRQGDGPPWSLIRPQLVAIAALVIAAVTGLIRMFVGTGAPAGTLVNIAWVAFDLVLLSVIIRAALYKGYTPDRRR